MPAIQVNPKIGSAIEKARVAAKFSTKNAAAQALKMASQQYAALESIKKPNMRLSTVAALCSVFPALKPADFFTAGK